MRVKARRGISEWSHLVGFCSLKNEFHRIDKRVEHLHVDMSRAKRRLKGVLWLYFGEPLVFIIERFCYTNDGYSFESKCSG